MPKHTLDRPRTAARHARVRITRRGRAVRVLASAACLTTALTVAPAVSAPEVTYRPAAGGVVADGAAGRPATRAVVSRSADRPAPPEETPPATASREATDEAAPPSAAPTDAPTAGEEAAPEPSGSASSSPSPQPSSTAAAAQPSPTVTPTPTPTSAPPSAESPSPSPSPSSPAPQGRPGPRNTGVPDGTQLRVHDGNLRIREAGTVVDGVDVRGFVFVEAKDVTIRRSVVRGGPTGSTKGLIHVSDPGASVVVEDTTLVPSTPSPYINGLHGANITARRVDISQVIDAAHLYGVGNVTIEDSWLHDNAHFAKDPNWNGGPSHDDSIQIQEGSRYRFRNNTISGATGAAVQFTQDRGRVSDVVIDGNWIGGGGCTINFSEGGRGPFTGVAITNNTFGRDTAHASCAIIAPDSTAKRLTVSGNVFTDGVAARVRTG